MLGPSGDPGFDIRPRDVIAGPEPGGLFTFMHGLADSVDKEVPMNRSGSQSV